MNAAILVESLTGNTWKAAELVADELQQAGWGITGLSKVRQPDHASIQQADLVLVGTWVHGLFVVGQGPWAAAELSQLPAMRGKKAAVFCTFALNPAKTLDKMTTIIDIHMKDGRTISGQSDFGKGSPINPMSYDECADKFRGCAEFAKWPDDKAEAIIKMVRTLDKVGNVRELTAFCA